MAQAPERPETGRAGQFRTQFTSSRTPPRHFAARNCFQRARRSAILVSHPAVFGV
jgi:hypothetical protein